MKQLFLFCFLFAIAAQVQQPVSPNYVAGNIVGNDSLLHVNLPVVNVYPPKKFKNKSEEQQYWRMVMRVKKVLPYAREAALLLKKYENEVPFDARRRDRHIYVKKAEDELMAKYGPTIRKMSINDGRVLIKLIDRETQMVSYDVIREVKGGVSAVFWQGVARIFGNNLKSTYDPKGEDWQIEQIIYFIDSGLI